MARNNARTPVRITRAGARLGLVLAIGLFAGAAANAQDRAPRSRDTLKTAIDHYKRGDYDNATRYFAQAQVKQSDLSESERQDLKTFSAQNGLAVKGRQEGAAQLRLAEEALSLGQTAEASNLAKLLSANQYLSPADRQAVTSLNVRLQTSAASGQSGTADPKALLTGARTALQQGDLDTADALAIQAEKAGSGFSFLQPWGDSPAKIRRDVQAARAKTETPETKDSMWTLTGMKNLITRGTTASEKPPVLPESPKPVVPEGSFPEVDLSKLGTTATTSKYGPPSPYSPVQAVGPNPKETTPANDSKSQARQLLFQGYKAMEANDLETARKLANQAKDLRATLDAKELGPDQLLGEIQRRSTGAKPAASVAPGDSRGLVRESRNLIAQNRLEEAEKMCNLAAAVPNARWGLFEDSPEKLRRDLQKARSKREREESVKLLTDARKLYTQGNLQEAKRLAYRAQTLHGPYGPFDFGDRPQRLIDEIARAEVQEKRDSLSNPMPIIDNKNPSISPFAKNDPAKAPLNSAAAQSAMKNRAVVLLRQARELEKNNQLVDAWQKATEAKKLGATFSLGEESPESTLQALAAKGKRQIQTTLQQVTESVSRGSDPARFTKAQAELAGARKMAQTFGLDTHDVDQKGAWLQQAASASGVNPSGGIAQAGANSFVTTAGLTTTGSPPGDLNRKAGLDKLEKARLELRSGNTAVARRIAEDAFNPAHGVQKEAAAIIATIDAEEHNQRVLAAERTLEAGIDAFTKRDFRRAGSILREVDLTVLAPERQVRVREIMGTREMQPQAVVQSGLKEMQNGDKPGTAVASDAAKTDDDPLEHVRAMEKVQFDRMAQQGLQVQRSALEMFKAGQEMKAIELLSGHLNQVNGAQLDPDRTRQLRTNVEKRLQEFRTLQAQKLIDTQRRGNPSTGHNEGEYVAKDRKQKEQISEMVRQCNLLRKDGRDKDALAAAYKIRELDPDNVANTASIGILEMKLAQKSFDDAKRENERTRITALNSSMGPTPTDAEPFKMSKDAIGRHQMRSKDPNIWSQRTNPVERAIEQKLSQPYSFNFKKMPLSDVIELLQRQTGVNVVANTLKLQENNINPDVPLDLYVEQMSLKSALNILLGKVKLTYVIRDEALQITTEDDARGRLRQVVYPVADLVVPVENKPLPDIYNLKTTLERSVASQNAMLNYAGPSPVTGANSLPAAPTVSSYNNGLGSAFGANSTSQPQATANSPGPQRRPGQTMEDTLMDLIKGTVHSNSWKDVGGGGQIQYYPLGMALVINQTQEVQGDIADLLAALRRLQDMEVSIEMRLVSVSEAFYERIGVDFDVNLRTPNSRFENQLLNGSFTPFGSVNRNLSFGGLVSGMTPAGTLTSDLNVPLRNSSFGFSVPPFGGYTAPGVDGGLSLGLAFLSDIQVFMLLEAAQGDRRTNIMQAPKITVFNGQTAFINVSVSQFLNLGITVIPVNGQIVFQPNNVPVPVGVNLTVTPVVSADRRFVRLNLTPNMTNFVSNDIPVFPVTIPVPNLIEGPGGLVTPTGQPGLFQSFQLNLQQPNISTISIDTTVNVPDGGTVLLGGLKTMSEGRNEAGPPVLSKIPYLSRLFRNVGYGREGQSLMIMVTPRIIINEEEERIFLGLDDPIPRP